MSTLRVNKIANLNDNGPVSLEKGLILPSGFAIDGNVVISTTGIATVTSLVAENVNVTGVMTATTFLGDASALTNLPGLSNSKTVALNFIT
jgi:hypothetical protein